MKIDDIDEAELLIDLEREEFLEKYRRIAASKKETGGWYSLDGTYKGSLRMHVSETKFTKAAPPKHPGLGCRCVDLSAIRQPTGHRPAEKRHR